MQIGSPRDGQRIDSFQPGSLTSQPDREAPQPGSFRPDLDRLREQFSGTPPPNIPPRPLVPPTSSSPFRSPRPPALGDIGTPRSQPQTSYGGRTPRMSRPGTPGIGRSGRATPDPFGNADAEEAQIAHLDDLPDEEKARILRKHLVSKEERAQADETEASGSGQHVINTGGASSRASIAEEHHRQGTEPFPIHFDVPGADATYVSPCVKTYDF
jgi:proton-coupled amino acid transporter